MKDKRSALIVEELSDDEVRFILDVRALCLDFDELSIDGNSVAYLLDTHFLSATSNTLLLSLQDSVPNCNPKDLTLHLHLR